MSPDDLRSLMREAILMTVARRLIDLRPVEEDE